MPPEKNGQLVYRKILEIGPMPPPRQGWSIRIDFLLKRMHELGVDCAALDTGVSRKVRRQGCEDVQSGWDYARKVVLYLWRGYRLHNHLNGESMKAYLLVFYATALSWCFRRPSVLTWHGGLGYRFFPSTENRLVDFFPRTIFRLSDKIICNDRKIKARIKEFGVPDQKVVSIPAFSRQYTEFQQVKLPHGLERFLQCRSPRLFAYVNFRPEFYIDVLVQAVKEIVSENPNLGLVLVGFTRGTAGFTEGDLPTRRLLAQAGLEPHVFFADDLEHDSFLTLLSRSDICIRTHKRDGISSSVLEALSLGIPVVAAANPLRPPQVTCYEAEDSVGLAQAIRQVLALPPNERRPVPPDIPDTIQKEVEILTGSTF